MYEKEEQMLRNYFQDAESNAASIAEDTLESTVQEGIRKGKRAKRSYFRYRGATLLAGVLAVVLFLVWGGLQQQSTQVEHIAAGPFPSLEGYNFEGDTALNTANKHGLIQPVDKSVTKGNYTVTVEGVLVGSQQLNVLYTVENRSERKAIMRGTTLENPDSDSTFGYSSGSSGNSEVDPGVHNLQVDYTLDDVSTIPSNVDITFQIAPDSANARAGRKEDVEGEEKLKVGITLDLDTYKKYIRTVKLDQTVEIQGQKMNLREIVFSPAGVALKGNVSGGNTMKVFGLWNPSLDSTKDGIITPLTSYMNWWPNENGDMTYFFNGSVLDEPDSLILRADGLFAVDPDKMKVVVDTEKGVVLSAPNDNIKFGSYTDSKEGHTLTIEYEDSNDQYRGSMSIADEFIDGEGNKHKVGESSDGVRSSKTSTETGGTRSTEYLYLKPEKYPQPLTFTLNSYPGVIEKSIEVPIIAEGKDIKYRTSEVLDNLPKPEGAQEGSTLSSSNPNIRIGVRYELKNIGGEQGLYLPTAYFQQLKAAGWTEIEEERMGHVHFFKKNDSVVSITVQEDWIDIYEMEEGQSSN